MDLEEVKRNSDLLQRVMSNFRQRLQQTARRHGENMIGVIFKK
jgi:hypothetical protein